MILKVREAHVCPRAMANLQTFRMLGLRDFGEIIALQESNGFILGKSLVESSFGNHTIRWSWK